MCDFEQRIYVIEIYLLQVKYVDGVWMEGGEVYDRVWKVSVVKVVIVVQDVVLCGFDIIFECVGDGCCIILVGFGVLFNISWLYCWVVILVMMIFFD